MRWLIVTADDFGQTAGVSRGIIKAHSHGILTSTSLMVGRPWSSEAAALGREWPALSIGLHLELDPDDGDRVADDVERQAERFRELIGAEPTHVDSHHDVHHDPRILPHVLAWARRAGVPLRGHSQARHVGKFYGQWAGESHFEQIGVEGLLRIIDEEVGIGVTELTCHPAETDQGLDSSYNRERPVELQTLCDPRVREGLIARDIRLLGFRHLHLLVPPRRLA